MKGPVGVYEDKKFSKGTIKILKALAKETKKDIWQQ